MWKTDFKVKKVHKKSNSKELTGLLLSPFFIIYCVMYFFNGFSLNGIILQYVPVDLVCLTWVHPANWLVCIRMDILFGTPPLFVNILGIICNFTNLSEEKVVVDIVCILYDLQGIRKTGPSCINDMGYIILSITKNQI